MNIQLWLEMGDQLHLPVIPLLLQCNRRQEQELSPFTNRRTTLFVLSWAIFQIIRLPNIDWYVGILRCLPVPSVGTKHIQTSLFRKIRLLN